MNYFRTGITIISLCCLSTGCRAKAELKEVQRVRSGNVDVILLSPDGLVHQKETLIIEFHKPSTGDLVDVGNVKVNTTMPMPGMAPMFGTANIRPGDTPGRYLMESAMEMSGSWRVVIDWTGATEMGHVALNATVQ